MARNNLGRHKRRKEKPTVAEWSLAVVNLAILAQAIYALRVPPREEYKGVTYFILAIWTTLTIAFFVHYFQRYSTAKAKKSTKRK